MSPVEKPVGVVMVLGGGISGMQASLDLAEEGFKVYLVEKSPAIGGTMPMLDKTFPTNDCSMCILSPKLVECGRHRNIEVITQAEVINLQGNAGNFIATVKKQPRYVDPAKCLSCGACAEECPAEVPSEFNQGLGNRKAVYKPYAQAFPNAYVIDKANCLECMACVDACPANAINHDMEEEILEIPAGAIILCSGFELINSELRGEFGYGDYSNVITSLQFERMLSASGPFQGHLKRPSDGSRPGKIAFIQCVGSRDLAKGYNYCSAVCCMYATKEAIIAKEHEPDLDITIFYIDIRAYGKDFEKYYNRAKKDYNLRYIRCMVSSIKELQQTKNLLISYRNESGQTIKEDFDMVVLSAGIKPEETAVRMSNILGIDLNQNNFCKVNSLTGVETSRPGVFVAGASCGPKDIPETVTQASAAAGDASALLSPARNTMVADKDFPPEKDADGEKPRLGVFVCHCGINIGSVVNVPAVVEAVKSLPYVVHAQESMYACAQDSQAAMKEIIEDKNLNRIVVASCSPRTHKPLFQETLRDAGLNRHLFEMANIRDQCSWVHMHEPRKATDKAKDLVKAAVIKAACLQPVKQVTVDVNHTALVVGGGIAGMTAALEIARQGYCVELVEITDTLGGTAKKISRGFPGDDVEIFSEQLINSVAGHPLINIHTGCEITEVTGYTGNFSSRLSSGEEIRHGVAIIATGGEEYRPEEYLYGIDDRVMTQTELEKILSNDDPRLHKAGNIVMIQCVGSREESRPYCSRICCSKTMKLALMIKEKNPLVNIFVLYRDIRTYSFLENQYCEAREKGVVFIRYDLERKPLVENAGLNGNSALKVSTYDPIIREPIEINTDIIALAPAILASQSNKKLSQLFKVPLNADGFFLEAHMKLKPVDFPAEGIYMCGLAHSPKNIEESIIQAKAAAGRATTILSRKQLESKGVTAHVLPDKCAACLTCVRLCPFNAPHINPVTQKAEIEAVQCQGCGVCSGECPNKAIELQGYTDKQQMCALEGLFLTDSKV
ncbi:MAG: CoB--CoM heterodisulfide reductase iron-sulfur subunit A family protein [Peptococcaceae bacterium]|nr:MAG: CoB--CoM heterodisulfide reductase iron-sulfur subunit A family protein [Peptococcaceae bacterium]